MTALESYLETHAARHLDELFEFLRIPSVSTAPEHVSDVVRCAEFLVDQFAGLGFEVEACPTAGHPIVLARYHHAPGAPTVLFYGHYDVQPPDPLDLWHSPPFDPVIVDGAVIARGASDDKGQVFAHIKGIEALLATEATIPVNLTFLIEGEEECGSASLNDFLVSHRETLAADVVIISDTAMFAPNVPTICYGLRGLAYVQVNVTGPSRDLHSGSFGGAVDNPINVLAQMIAKLKDEQGIVRIPGFYEDVAELTELERAELAALPFDEVAFLAEAGTSGHGEPGFTTLERLGVRPTLDVCGIWGGFTGKGAKTVLPSKAHAKISMRLVPHQDVSVINRRITEFLTAIAPPTVVVDVDVMYGSSPSVSNRESPYVKAASRAVESVFGKPPLFVREGGSIPVVGTFKDLLGLDSVLVGFGLPDDRIHSPNEKFDLANYHANIRFATRIWPEIAAIVEQDR